VRNAIAQLIRQKRLRNESICANDGACDKKQADENL
jgi:hypothetical protein